MKLTAMLLSVLSLIGGLIVLAVSVQIGTAILLVSVVLAVLGLAVAIEENHRELLEHLERNAGQGNHSTEHH